MVAPVTQGEEAVQNARGSFDPKTYENTAKAVPNVAPLDGADLPDVPGFVAGPRGAVLPMGNFAQAPHPLDVGPIQQAFANAQSDFKAGEAARSRAQAEQDKSNVSLLALQQEREALSWTITGKGQDGQAYSADDLDAKHYQEFLSTGLDATEYRPASATSRQIIREKSHQDVAAAVSAQKELDNGIAKSEASYARLTFQGLQSNRADSLTGRTDIQTGLQQLYETADTATKTPKGREIFLDKGFQMLAEETKGDHNTELLMSQFQHADDLRNQLVQNGEDPAVAEELALNQLAHEGIRNPQLKAMLDYGNGIKHDRERYQGQLLQNKIATKEWTEKQLQFFDPSHTDSLFGAGPDGKPLVEDPRNVDALIKGLNQVQSPKAFQMIGKLQEMKRDAEFLQSKSSKILTLEGQLKEAQNPRQHVAGTGGKQTDQKAAWDKAVFLNQIPKEALFDTYHLKDNVLPSIGPKAGQLTDLGRVLMGKSELLSRVRGDAKRMGQAFNTDGSYTPYGASHVKPFEAPIPAGVWSAIHAPNSPVKSESSAVNPWQAKVGVIKEQLDREKQNYNSVQQKYQRSDGSNFNQFPTLDQRRKGLEFHEGFKRTMGDTPASRAGGGAVAQAASGALNRLSFTGGDVDGGNLACAKAVTNVLKQAGIPVKSTLSTINLDNQFKDGLGVPVSWGGARAGDVIISPMTGSRHGHTGICMNDGCTTIASNSGAQKVFTTNFTKASWISQIQEGRNLVTNIYRPKGNAAEFKQAVKFHGGVMNQADQMQRQQEQEKLAALQTPPKLPPKPPGYRPERLK